MKISGGPITIEVDGEDGHTYAIEAALAVFQIKELDEVDRNGLPVFEIDSAVAFRTRGLVSPRTRADAHERPAELDVEEDK